MCSLCPDAPWPEDEPMTDLEAYEAVEDLASPDATEHHPSWISCGTWDELWVPEYGSHYGKCPKCPPEPHEVEVVPCPNCADAPELGCIGPHLVEGAEVVLFNKPGTVRWVLPEGKGVAVVFEDGMMYWAYAEHIGEIRERE